MVTSISSFSYNVFKRLLSHGHEKSGLCGKELTLNNNIKILMSLEKIESMQGEKEKMLVTVIFSYIHIIF